MNLRRMLRGPALRNHRQPRRERVTGIGAAATALIAMQLEHSRSTLPREP